MTVDDGLSGWDLLAYRELVPANERGADGTGADVPTSGVRCGRPLTYPVPVADLPMPLRRRAEALGGRYVGALFAFDLDELPDGQRYTAARFEVALADRRIVAVQLHGDGDALGLVHGTDGSEAASATAVHTIEATRTRPGWLRRLASRPGTPRAWTVGTQTPDFGWVYDDPRGELLLPRTYGMHALLEVPAGATELRGTLGVQVEIAGSRRERAGHRFARLRDAVPFADPLTPVEAPGGAAVRLCMAADVSGYSRRGNAETERIQSDLVDVLARARRAAGIAESAVASQPQGDGQFTVLPVGIDESVVIPHMVRGLDTALRELNQATPAGDRLRLRVALHRGLIKKGRNGWIGTAPIAVHRILDSPPLRTALRDHVGADFVLGVPDVLFRDVIRHAVEPPLPGEFTPVTVELPEKGFIEHGWLHIGPEDER